LIGERYGGSPQREKRRRRGFLLLLMLPLVLTAFALGGVTGAWLHGDSHPVATGSAPVPTVEPSARATGTESVRGVEIVASPTPAGTGDGSATAQAGGANFTITGGAGHLAPGVRVPLLLKLTNPNGVAIQVTALSVAISADSTPPGCTSAANIRLTQSNASSANPITVPAGGSVTLTSTPRAPQIELINLPDVNQDVCKGKTFTLTYSGSAHS